MHLGRFHAVVAELAAHYRETKVSTVLESAAAALDQLDSNRDQAEIEAFRGFVEDAKRAGDAENPDLFQPFARDVVEQLGLEDTFNPALAQNIDALVSTSGFDVQGLAQKLRRLSASLSKKIESVQAIDSSFTRLDVEYQRVDSNEAEVGLILPREVVGERLSSLSSEFNEINKLAKAINELVGGGDYEPRVVTISSSAWQVFLDLTPEQIAIWVLAIERIINLFKTNLEIKALSNQLREKNLPEKITKAIEQEVNKRVKAQLDKLAKEIRKGKRKAAHLEGRANELETQLRHGLYYLAKRLSQGAKVEINLPIPEEPKEPTAPEGAAVDGKQLQQYQKDMLAYQALTDLRAKALFVSSETTEMDKSSPLQIEAANDDDGAEGDSGPE
jgi:hypothetical protein